MDDIKMFFEVVLNNKILASIIAFLCYFFTFKKMEIDVKYIFIFLNKFFIKNNSNDKKILNQEERKNNYEEFKNGREEYEKLKDILIKLEPLELDEHSNIICPNDAETVNDAILALARLTDFLQDEAEHMEPIRRMAFILLQQTWRGYVQPSYEDINQNILTETASPVRSKNREQLISIFTDLIPNKSVISRYKTQTTVNSNAKLSLAHNSILQALSKTLMRGLVSKNDRKIAELTQDVFKNELDDLFLVGLDTTVCPDMNLLIKNIELKYSDFSISNLNNVIFKNVTLNTIQFKGVVLNGIVFDNVVAKCCFFNIFSCFSKIHVRNEITFKEGTSIVVTLTSAGEGKPKSTAIYLCPPNLKDKPMFTFDFDSFRDSVMMYYPENSMKITQVETNEVDTKIRVKGVDITEADFTQHFYDLYKNELLK